jgi:hypothetical protein
LLTIATVRLGLLLGVTGSLLGCARHSVGGTPAPARLYRSPAAAVLGSLPAPGCYCSPLRASVVLVDPRVAYVREIPHVPDGLPVVDQVLEADLPQFLEPNVPVRLAPLDVRTGPDDTARIAVIRLPPTAQGRLRWGAYVTVPGEWGCVVVLVLRPHRHEWGIVSVAVLQP